MSGKIRIGTSGWYYDHWRENFYPADLKKDKFLEYYAHTFKTVEINNSFYRLPLENTFLAWKKKAPEDFLFTVKLSRYITHEKRLKECKEALDLFLERAGALGKKFGPVLVQLPPSFKRNDERLIDFLKILPQKRRFTFEFRHDTWFTPEVLTILEDYNAALCLYDLKGVRIEDVVTADWVYIRLHGPTRVAYAGSYEDEALEKWAERIRTWAGEGRDVFCYFDNDQKAYAVGDALRLIAKIK